MRRIFIMRKDLHMSPGKLAAQVGHCAEAYWTNKLKVAANVYHSDNPFCEDNLYSVGCLIRKDVYDEYLCGKSVKIICEARNKNHLLKVVDIAKQLGLVENVHYGMIYDACFTELTPEEENGTTLTGIWFAPLKDEQAKLISEKYHLYV